MGLTSRILMDGYKYCSVSYCSDLTSAVLVPWVGVILVHKSSRRWVFNTTTPQATQQKLHFLFSRSRRTMAFLWYRNFIACEDRVRKSCFHSRRVRGLYPRSPQFLGSRRSTGSMVTRQHGQSVFPRSHLLTQSWWNTWLQPSKGEKEILSPILNPSMHMVHSCCGSSSSLLLSSSSRILVPFWLSSAKPSYPFIAMPIFHKTCSRVREQDRPMFVLFSILLHSISKSPGSIVTIATPLWKSSLSNLLILQYGTEWSLLSPSLKEEDASPLLMLLQWCVVFVSKLEVKHTGDRNSFGVTSNTTTFVNLPSALSPFLNRV